MRFFSFLKSASSVFKNFLASLAGGAVAIFCALRLDLLCVSKNALCALLTEDLCAQIGIGKSNESVNRRDVLFNFRNQLLLAVRFVFGSDGGKIAFAGGFKFGTARRRSMISFAFSVKNSFVKIILPFVFSLSSIFQERRSCYL